jgi:hypothetical protein
MRGSSGPSRFDRMGSPAAPSIRIMGRARRMRSQSLGRSRAHGLLRDGKWCEHGQPWGHPWKLSNKTSGQIENVRSRYPLGFAGAIRSARWPCRPPASAWRTLRWPMSVEAVPLPARGVPGEYGRHGAVACAIPLDSVGMSRECQSRFCRPISRGMLAIRPETSAELPSSLRSPSAHGGCEWRASHHDDKTRASRIAIEQQTVAHPCRSRGDVDVGILRGTRRWGSLVGSALRSAPRSAAIASIPLDLVPCFTPYTCMLAITRPIGIRRQSVFCRSDIWPSLPFGGAARTVT